VSSESYSELLRVSNSVERDKSCENTTELLLLRTSIAFPYLHVVLNTWLQRDALGTCDLLEYMYYARSHRG